MRGWANRAGAVLLVAVLASLPAGAQSLRFSNRRQVEVPDYATLRLGPFYSTLTLSQSIGVQYVRIEGEGVDFLFGSRRGEFKRDGYDFPIITTLALRNYLIISRNMDLEANLRIQYRYYPMRTQENELLVDFSDEGIFADLSTEFQLTPTLRGRLYDNASYRTQIIDVRGEVDRYGGERFERFENEVGLDLDWLVSRHENVALSLSRHDSIPLGDSITRTRTWSYRESLAYERQFSPFLVGGVRGNAQQRFSSRRANPANYTQGIELFTDAQVTRYMQAGGSVGYSLGITRGGDPFVRRSSASLTYSAYMKQQLTPRLDHEVSGSRRIQNAFITGIDINDRLAYRLNWRTGYLPGYVSTALNRFDPVESDRNGWTDWTSQLAVSQRVSRLVNMGFMTAYSARWNETTDLQVPVDASADYTTWVARVSMTMPLTRSVDFMAYAEHAERDSDATELRYTRDLVAAIATWSYRF